MNIVPGKPAIIMTWIGSEPELPSILLNSHTDVVPVARELWTHDPFAADKDESGNIFGRGSQDMKSVGIQHLEAIFRIKDLQKKRLKRTVHIRCFNSAINFATIMQFKLFNTKITQLVLKGPQAL